MVEPPLWKMMEFVSWDDEFPNIWENKSHVPNHQPVIYKSIHLWVEITPFGDDSPQSNHDSRLRSQCGHYHLPRLKGNVAKWHADYHQTLVDFPQIAKIGNRRLLSITVISCPIGSMYAIWGAPWIPSIYPSHVSIYMGLSENRVYSQWNSHFL